MVDRHPLLAVNDNGSSRGEDLSGDVFPEGNKNGIGQLLIHTYGLHDPQAALV